MVKCIIRYELKQNWTPHIVRPWAAVYCMKVATPLPWKGPQVATKSRPKLLFTVSSTRTQRTYFQLINNPTHLLMRLN